MHSSGLIYAVIIGMWALVLIPMWLRRHDEATEARSVEKFSTAMRVLSRRTAPAGEHRYVIGPLSDSDDATADASRPRKSWRLPPAPLPVSPAARAAARRRQVALLLAIGLVLLVLALVVGLIGPAAPVIVGMALIAYLLNARREAMRSAARRSPRARPTVRTVAAGSRPRGIVPDAPAELPDDGAAEAPVDAAEAIFDQETNTTTWQPVPVPLPTYVTAPVVRRTRTIDLTPAGSWAPDSAAAEEAEDQRPPTYAPSAHERDDDDDEGSDAAGVESADADRRRHAVGD